MRRTSVSCLAVAGLGLLGWTGAAGASDDGSTFTPATDSTPNSIVLEGTLRDFKVSHPDMQHEHKSFGVRKNLVEAELDGGIGVGKPVLNTSTDYSKGMITSPDTFDQWFRNVEGVNKALPYAITLEPLPGSPGVFFYAREKQSSDPAERYFFPLDDFGSDVCWDDKIDASTGTHNFYFTYELRTLFSYTSRDRRDDPSQDLEFKFVGDDDVWVFINGKLAVDIGGVHGQSSGEVNLDEQAAALGLEPDGVYELVLFFAERHTTQSNFRIETTLKLSTETDPLYD
ncbi:MAG: fibro-slime domain-containing protein [Planctomycetota bacterium]